MKPVKNMEGEMLRGLAGEVRQCMKCGLHRSRRHAVPGEGSIHARLFLVGQAPGEDEDRAGRMFTGPSGRIFDRLLESAGIRREEIYMSNLVKCYLPKCRRPSRPEIEACSVFLDRELQIMNPRWIIPLGFHATRYVFRKYGIPRPVKHEYHRLFGREFMAGRIRILPLRHPTALLFNPEKEDLMKENYRKLAGLVGKSDAGT